MRISVQDHQLNEDIRDKEVRLIGEEGEQLGIMSSKDAQKAAQTKGLDLVKIAPQATPPVCKIMDYGKFKFEQTKREKEAKKNQHIVEIKGIRLSPNIDVHDFDTKLKHGVRFLKDGDKLKVSIRFRGREMAHTSSGYEIMARYADACAEFGVIERPAKLDGRNMLMFLSPKAPVQKSQA